MAWMKLETSVARNRKFVKAGPAPSWLWVCGLAYCQESLTDGFIPHEALPFLGVKNASQLASHLVKAGLWDEADGGWRIHDYLEHNRPASAVREIREERRRSGSMGGVASGQARRSIDKHFASGGAEAHAKQPANPVTATDTATTTATAPPIAEGDFERFQRAYPGHRVKGSYRIQTMFFDAVQHAGGVRPLLDALENHKASEQWQTPKLIPGMDTWLAEERWRQRLDPPPSSPKKPWGTWRPQEAS